MAKIEEQTGPFQRFNIFRALRIDAHEIRHSNFLGWILDPSESHGQRDLFLRRFVDLVLSISTPTSRATDSIDLSNAEVRRESDQLDVRIVVPERRLVIGIENKLFTREHSDQLARYASDIGRDFKGWQHALMYLTLDGEEPSDSRWQPLSHHAVLGVISGAAHGLAPETPQELRSFIQHYIGLISDIYSRRAAATESPRVPEVMEAIAATVQLRPGWFLVSRSTSLVECGPIELLELLPAIGSRHSRNPRHWLTLRFHDHGARGYVGRYWRPSDVSDLARRNKVLRALVESSDHTGFKYKAGSLDSGLSKDYPAFSGDQIQDARTGRIPSVALLCELINRELGAVESRLPSILRLVQAATNG